MLNELRLVDLIERVYAERPYCECGRDTVTTYRDGGVWLDCAIVREPIENRLHRMWSAVTEPAHVHSLIADIPEPEFLVA